MMFWRCWNVSKFFAIKNWLIVNNIFMHNAIFPIKCKKYIGDYKTRKLKKAINVILMQTNIVKGITLLYNMHIPNYRLMYIYGPLFRQRWFWIDRQVGIYNKWYNSWVTIFSIYIALGRIRGRKYTLTELNLPRFVLFFFFVFVTFPTMLLIQSNVKILFLIENSININGKLQNLTTILTLYWSWLWHFQYEVQGN